MLTQACSRKEKSYLVPQSTQLSKKKEKENQTPSLLSILSSLCGFLYSTINRLAQRVFGKVAGHRLRSLSTQIKVMLHMMRLLGSERRLLMGDLLAASLAAVSHFIPLAILGTVSAVAAVSICCCCCCCFLLLLLLPVCCCQLWWWWW